MVVKGYTTEELIEAEIGKAITDVTTPTSTQLSVWIEEAEGYIDRRTHTSFTSVTETDKIYNWNEHTAFVSPTNSGFYGNVGRKDYGFLKFGTAFRLDKQPIINMTGLSLNQAGASDVDSWDAKTESVGSGGDYVVDKDTGIVSFLTAIPRFGERSIKVTYNYGHSEIPTIVQWLTTKIVARRVIDMKIKNSAFTSTDSVSLASLSIKKEITENMRLLQQLDIDIDELFKQVGELYAQWV